MNIYEKLQTMRVALQNMNLKKSGQNKFSGYNYFELGDFLPAINQLMLDNKVTSIITFDTNAVLTLINTEKTDETITFTSPMREAVLKGAHPIQNLGAVETYSRRYLYMVAFEIVESDMLDAPKSSSTEIICPSCKKAVQKIRFKDGVTLNPEQVLQRFGGVCSVCGMKGANK